MKCIAAIAAAGSLIWLAGCASAPKVAIVEPVGPAPAKPTTVSGEGYLQVFSARQRGAEFPEIMMWEWDYPLQRDALNYGLAHTDYIIRTEENRPLQYVRNATDMADPQPARVSLPPGRYKVEAEAEETGGRTVKVLLPVLIEPGRTTVAHLSGNWQPKAHFNEADVVRLPDGQIAGWLAAH
jgi:hypothetical protein